MRLTVTACRAPRSSRCRRWLLGDESSPSPPTNQRVGRRRASRCPPAESVLRASASTRRHVLSYKEVRSNPLEEEGVSLPLASACRCGSAAAEESLPSREDLSSRAPTITSRPSALRTSASFVPTIVPPSPRSWDRGVGATAPRSASPSHVNTDRSHAATIRGHTVTSPGRGHLSRHPSAGQGVRPYEARRRSVASSRIAAPVGGRLEQRSRSSSSGRCRFRKPSMPM